MWHRRFGRRGILLAGAATAFVSQAAGCAHLQPPSEPPAPKLVVMLSIDQLRFDLLQRYDRFYTGGFRRLLDEGAVFEAVHDHAWSETAPGHATLSTGVTPARSGIVGNDWVERVEGKPVIVYNVQDSLSPIVGQPAEKGMSPRNLRRTGLADWMQAANPRARVVSVAGKDRSAILMAGKSRGQVFWYNHALGRFITSSYYGTAYPEWLERFHATVLPTLRDSTWREQSPPAARALAGADTAAYEANGTHTFFPHDFRDDRAAFDTTYYRWASATPHIDRVVLGLAREAIRAEALGADDDADFLAIGLSQTDAVGHRFGPLSREQLDNLIRLDRELGAFFDELDRTVGRGRWVVGLSADHGANTAPEQLAAQGRSGYRRTAADSTLLEETAKRAAESATPDRIPVAVARALRALPFVADAYTLEEIARGVPRDSFVTLLRNSYTPGRFATDISERYGVEIRPREGVYMGAATGTGHSGPYFEDRWVPVIFLGAGIRPARATGVARTVDLAPTLAWLARVPTPPDLDGRPLLATSAAGTAVVGPR